MSAIDLRASLSTDADGALVVSLSGEMDLASSPLVTEWVSEALETGGSRVVIDLRDVSFIDSRGLATLVATHTEAHSAGKTVVVRAPTKRVMDLFLMTGLDHVLLIEPDELWCEGRNPPAFRDRARLESTVSGGESVGTVDDAVDAHVPDATLGRDLA